MHSDVRQQVMGTAGSKRSGEYLPMSHPDEQEGAKFIRNAENIYKEMRAAFRSFQRSSAVSRPMCRRMSQHGSSPGSPSAEAGREKGRARLSKPPNCSQFQNSAVR